jgi:aminoglycoside phosphotransferase (APT) family kinase protein
MRDRDEIEALASEILGGSVEATYLPVGFGSENWRIAGPPGDFVLKIGPLDAAEKWASAHAAHAVATSVGVPVAPLVHSSVRDFGVVRMYEWVAGQSPATVTNDASARTRFLSDLGAAIAALHSVELREFSSRLDGSAPSFPRWCEYVAHRVPQIRDRCARSDALDAASVEETCDAVLRELDPVLDALVRPVVCHRDLHADNLLVDEHGALVAVLDWDLAEAWDPAGEWFKLEFKLFHDFTGGDESFMRAYGPVPGAWERRVRIVDLMETLNSIANVRPDERGGDWDTRLRARLVTLTRSPR